MNEIPEVKYYEMSLEYLARYRIIDFYNYRLILVYYGSQESAYYYLKRACPLAELIYGSDSNVASNCYDTIFSCLLYIILLYIYYIIVFIDK